MFVVTGVTGNTGKVVAENLLSAGKKVRVVVRDAKKGDPGRARGAEVAAATCDDEIALARAREGAEGAYVLFPPFGYTDTNVAKTREAIRKTLVGAITKARPRHVVFLS